MFSLFVFWFKVKSVIQASGRPLTNEQIVFLQLQNLN